MRKQSEYDLAAIAGYTVPLDSPAVINGNGSPYLWSSPMDAAWRIGFWLKITGRSSPRNVRPSRGDTFHVNDMKVKFDWSSKPVAIERIS